jgi:outer membrane protein
MSHHSKAVAGTANEPRFSVRARAHLRTTVAAVCGAAALGLSSPNVSAADDLIAILSAAEDMDPFYREAQDSALAVAEGIPQARANLWLPRLNFQTSTRRVEQDITLDSRGAFGAGGKLAFSAWDYRVNIEQPVWNYDRIIALKQADARLQQAQLEVLVAHQDMMLRVAERYFEVLAARDNLAFAEAEKQSLQSQFEQAEQRFKVGLIAITDVQEAKAGHDRALANEIIARNEIENANERLREVTGLYHLDLAELSLEVPLTMPVPENIEAWTTTALNSNLDLSAALKATEIAQKEISRQFAQHMPTLDIIGSHGFNRQGGRFGSAEIEQGEIGMVLNLPIYEGGRTTSLTRQAEHQHAAALERLEQTRRAVQRATREAYLGIAARISSANALQQAVVSSQTALESTRAGFEVGTRTAIDVVAAERGLSEARRDYAQARYNYIVDTLRLKKAAGSLQPEDLAVTNSWLVDNSDDTTAAPDESADNPGE